MKLVLLALLVLTAACARNYEDYNCTMPMTNNPNIINVRQQGAMPGMNM